ALLRLRQCALIPALIDDRFRQIESAKMEMLEEMIDEILSGGHKVLVFSQFVEALKTIADRLSARRYRYAYLDGQTKDRAGAIQSFREDPAVKIFLLSLKAGGVGINLTEADYVILFDPWWNPAVESQAVDRAHRMGQTEKVTVYRLLAKDTVEERIEELKQKKRALVADLITPEAQFYKSLTREDIMRLLGSAND
ncbi:MAG TPA: DEAD/DEAH box helicase, partial [Spirochaetia bacterium]|nr:DEAD/DEAH box helicase [Spirochaetia bacterium]